LSSVNALINSSGVASAITAPNPANSLVWLPASERVTICLSLSDRHSAGLNFRWAASVVSFAPPPSSPANRPCAGITPFHTSGKTMVKSSKLLHICLHLPPRHRLALSTCRLNESGRRFVLCVLAGRRSFAAWSRLTAEQIYIIGREI